MHYISRFVVKNCRNNFNNQMIQKRKLFNLDSLKINTFKEFCKDTAICIPNIPSFKEEMKIKCEKDINYLIFVDDLKKMIAITKNNDDLHLLKDMIKKFSTQNNLISFNTFRLGPQIFRLLHVLNQPKEAISLIENPEFNWLFREITSYVLVADLLFRNEMFDDVIKLLYVFMNEQLKGKKFIPNLVILYFASCHKLNTSKSFKDACDLWKLLKEQQFKCPIRGMFFFSHLALKQKQTDVALDILSEYKPNAIGNNIKILAFTLNKEYEKIFSLLKNLFFEDVPQSNLQNFVTRDTLECVECIFQDNTEENYKNFEKIKAALIQYNLVHEKDLESFLYKELIYASKNKIFMS